MKTELQRISNNWIEVKNECRNTTNKGATEKAPSNGFKRHLLISEHSPIRLLEAKWRWEGIKSWVSVHFSRHWLGWDKWISTQRNDRTGIERDKSSQDTLVNINVRANAQALINVARYRLCYQASAETREYMEDLKLSIKEQEPFIADVMVPNCVYRCGCPEFKQCGFWKKFVNDCNELDVLTNIETRYELYNEQFYTRMSS